MARAAAHLFFSAYVIGVVLYVSSLQWICALMLAAGCAAMAWRERAMRPAVLKMMLVAGTLGTVGEWFCVHKFDLWQYHFPVILHGLPVWIGLVWAYLFALFILIAADIAEGWKRLGELVRRFLSVSFAVVFFLFLRHVFLEINVHISYYYILFMAVGIVIWRTPADAFAMIVAGIGGTAGEYMAIQKGLWHYTNPVFPQSGMPISLPLAWGLAAVYVRNASAMFWRSTLWLAAGACLLGAAVKVISR